MSGYFLYHSIGTYPGKAAAMAQALGDFSAVWSAEDDGQWPAALGMRQRFIDLWSDLIDAPTGTLTTAENVTTALYSLIGGLPEGMLRGKRVLVAADCFPSLHFLLVGLQQRFGFTLETVPLRPGEGWVRDEDMLERWDGTVGLALLTLVSSTTSHCIDAARLVAHGRAQGSLVVVDITQGVGIVPFSLRDIAADAVVSTSLKWLCGASGAGILQVRRDLIESCRPELRGWFSQENPFSWDLDRFTYAGDIRRFDHGTPSVLAAVASLPGLDWVTARGVSAMAAENRVHAHALLAGADALGWRLLSPREDEARGGSVMLQVPEPLVPAEVVATLRAQALFCDARGRTLRLSPGAVTTPEAIEALLSALRGLH